MDSGLKCGVRWNTSPGRYCEVVAEAVSRELPALWQQRTPAWCQQQLTLLSQVLALNKLLKLALVLFKCDAVVSIKWSISLSSMLVDQVKSYEIRG